VQVHLIHIQVARLLTQAAVAAALFQIQLAELVAQAEVEQVVIIVLQLMA
jgi:hypothetical protein